MGRRLTTAESCPEQQWYHACDEKDGMGSGRAFARAYAYVTERAGAARSRGCERLPTAQAMAAAAGVSHVTMLKAVRRMRDEGRLTVKHGRGIRITG
ncbi:MAG: GntR family transcriptional regulator, partial [Chitinivibrionales bacterium]|nr:GntR family transcriptional regulator [Chitinivibrionales bacterium]